MTGELFLMAAANMAIFIGVSGFIDYKLHAPKKKKHREIID
jgi:hypothetical protein